MARARCVNIVEPHEPYRIFVPSLDTSSAGRTAYRVGKYKEAQEAACVVDSLVLLQPSLQPLSEDDKRPAEFRRQAFYSAWRRIAATVSDAFEQQLEKPAKTISDTFHRQNQFDRGLLPVSRHTLPAVVAYCGPGVAEHLLALNLLVKRLSGGRSYAVLLKPKDCLTVRSAVQQIYSCLESQHSCRSAETSATCNPIDLISSSAGFAPPATDTAVECEASNAWRAEKTSRFTRRHSAASDDDEDASVSSDSSSSCPSSDCERGVDEDGEGAGVTEKQRTWQHPPKLLSKVTSEDLTEFCKSNQPESISVVFQTAEGFVPLVLSSLLSVLHTIRAEDGIPVNVVFGISTNALFLESLLGPDTTRLLCIHREELLRPKDLLNVLFQALLFDPLFPVQVDVSALRAACCSPLQLLRILLLTLYDFYQYVRFSCMLPAVWKLYCCEAETPWGCDCHGTPFDVEKPFSCLGPGGIGQNSPSRCSPEKLAVRRLKSLVRTVDLVPQPPPSCSQPDGGQERDTDLTAERVCREVTDYIGTSVAIKLLAKCLDLLYSECHALSAAQRIKTVADQLRPFFVYLNLSPRSASGQNSKRYSEGQPSSALLQEIQPAKKLLRQPSQQAARHVKYADAAVEAMLAEANKRYVWLAAESERRAAAVPLEECTPPSEADIHMKEHACVSADIRNSKKRVLQSVEDALNVPRNFNVEAFLDYVQCVAKPAKTFISGLHPRFSLPAMDAYDDAPSKVVSDKSPIRPASTTGSCYPSTRIPGSSSPIGPGCRLQGRSPIRQSTTRSPSPFVRISRSAPSVPHTFPMTTFSQEPHMNHRRFDHFVSVVKGLLDIIVPLSATSGYASAATECSLDTFQKVSAERSLDTFCRRSCLAEDCGAPASSESRFSCLSHRLSEINTSSRDDSSHSLAVDTAHIPLVCAPMEQVSPPLVRLVLAQLASMDGVFPWLAEAGRGEDLNLTFKLYQRASGCSIDLWDWFCGFCNEIVPLSTTGSSSCSQKATASRKKGDLLRRGGEDKGPLLLRTSRKELQQRLENELKKLKQRFSLAVETLCGLMGVGRLSSARKKAYCTRHQKEDQAYEDAQQDARQERASAGKEKKKKSDITKRGSKEILSEDNSEILLQLEPCKKRPRQGTTSISEVCDSFGLGIAREFARETREDFRQCLVKKQVYGWTEK